VGETWERLKERGETTRSGGKRGRETLFLDLFQSERSTKRDRGRETEKERLRERDLQLKKKRDWERERDKKRSGVCERDYERERERERERLTGILAATTILRVNGDDSGSLAGEGRSKIWIGMGKCKRFFPFYNPCSRVYSRDLTDSGLNRPWLSRVSPSRFAARPSQSKLDPNYGSGFVLVVESSVLVTTCPSRNRIGRYFKPCLGRVYIV